MDIKGNVLCKPKYLRRCPDEKCPVTTAEIGKDLADEGCLSAAEMVRDHFSMIRGYGFDIVVIEKSGQSFTYSYFDQNYSTPELLILSDAVSFSQFITKSKSEQLRRKLVAVVGSSYAEELRLYFFECGIYQSEKLVVLCNNIRKGAGGDVFGGMIIELQRKGLVYCQNIVIQKDYEEVFVDGRLYYGGKEIDQVLLNFCGFGTFETFRENVCGEYDELQ